MYDAKWQQRIDGFTRSLFGEAPERACDQGADLPGRVPTERERNKPLEPTPAEPGALGKGEG